MSLEHHAFDGAHGHRLAAVLERPSRPARATVLMAHCFTCGKDLSSAKRISSALSKLGFAVMRFDFTGLGRSEGELADTTFSSNIDDLVAAADYLRSLGQAPSLLVGHSLGGTAVLFAAPRLPEVVAVATIGAPSEPAHVERLLTGSIDEIEAHGSAEVKIAGRAFRISRDFLEDVRSHRIQEALTEGQRALLLFHSPVDAVVGIESAAALYRAARHPKSFISLDSADHLLSRQHDALYVARVLAAWADRYLDPTPPTEDLPGAVVVESTFPGPFTQVVSVGRHTLLADEPASVGGADQGPSPYDLLLASLGTCTAMTLQMYAQRKKLPLEGVRVTLTHQKIHAKDCAECETKEGRIDEITREIHLDGPLEESAVQRMLEIADLCPVHRTLHSEVIVKTRAATPTP